MFVFSIQRLLSKTVLIVCLLSMPIYSAGGVILKDGFESSDRLFKSGPAKWWLWNRHPDPEVTANKPRTGNYSLEFAYPGDGPDNPISPDSSKEQRFGLGGQYQELWIKFNLFIPGNFKHRARTDGNNNKFMYLSGPSSYFGFGQWPTSAGGPGSDYVALHLKYDGRDRGHKHGEGDTAPFVQTNTDLNKWHEWIIHVKFSASSSANDGAVEMWRNGKKVMEHLNLPNYDSENNYITEGYLMGWANSGYDETTTFYIDDVVFSTSQILPEGGESPPNPPDIR